MIKLLVPGIKITNATWLDGKVDQNRKIPGLLERICNAWIRIFWRSTKARSIPTRQDRVPPTPGELMGIPKVSQGYRDPFGSLIESCNCFRVYESPNYFRIKSFEYC